MEKKGVNKVLIATLIVIILAVIGILIAFIDFDKVVQPPDDAPLEEDTPSPIISNDTNDDIALLENLTRESGGGDSSSSEEGGGVPVCIERQISYSIKNLTKTSACNEMQDSSCVSKSVTCSIEVNNLDQNVGGLFRVQLKFLRDEDKQILYTEEKEGVLSGGQTRTLEAVFNLEGADADKVIVCQYESLEVPRITCP
ncbi:MAG: hypothetical protein ABIE22_01200 [archaeon]